MPFQVYKAFETIVLPRETLTSDKSENLCGYLLRRWRRSQFTTANQYSARV
jgi:hypothetical protein